VSNGVEYMVYQNNGNYSEASRRRSKTCISRFVSKGTLATNIPLRSRRGSVADILPTYERNENPCRKCIFYATLLNSYEQWHERSQEDVKTKIAQLVGNNFNVDKFEKDTEKLAGEIEDFQTQVELLISSIPDAGSKHPLAGIEKIEPRKALKAYITNYLSRIMMTRDSEAFAQGVTTPAIIYYDAVVYEAESIVSSTQQFVKACRNFITWYKLQGATLCF